MSFTFTKNLDVVEIRNPEFGNIRKIDNNDIKRFTRSGDVKVYASANWAVLRYHTYQWTVIKDVAPDDFINQLKTFFRVHAGEEITITDYLGNSYNGVIFTPVAEIINTRPDCSHGLSIDFLETP